MITNDKIQSCLYAHSAENKHTNVTKMTHAKYNIQNDTKIKWDTNCPAITNVEHDMQ